MTRITRALVFVILMTLCIGCDRVTKNVATETLRGSAPVSVAGGVVRLQYAENRGAFLGLGDSLGPRARFWLLGIGGAALLIAVAVALVRARSSWWQLAALTLILAGGVGNLVDRLSDGYVVDFLIVGLGGVHTGIFNVADMALMAGLLTLCVAGLRDRRSGRGDPEPAG